MPSRRVRWTSLLRPLAALALPAWLIYRIGARPVLDALALFRTAPACIATALALTFLALLTGAVRWHLLLRALALPNPFGTTFRAFFAGQFFNAFFFGACGGDLYRAYAAARRHPGREAEAAASVVIDRGIGLLATLAFGCLALLPGLRARLSDPAWRKASWLMLAFALVGIAATWAALADAPWTLASRLAPERARPLLDRLRTAFAFPRRNPRAAAVATLLSLANLLLLAAACHALSVAFSLTIPWPQWLAIFPVITVLSAIPLTPGGLGIREALFVALLAPLGIPPAPALALSLLNYLAGTFWSLFGAVLFVLPDDSPRSPEKISCIPPTDRV